jgi:pullulanase/glycogen debranching enzyme
MRKLPAAGLGRRIPSRPRTCARRAAAERAVIAGAGARAGMPGGWFPALRHEWNGKHRDTMRDFWRMWQCGRGLR